MRVLVTGGGGFIGSHLVDRFLQDGFQVRVLDSLHGKVHPHGRPTYLPAGIEFIHGSVTDRETLWKALQGVDVVSHQAAYQDYMPDFSHFLQVNAVSTALIYELIVQYRLPVMKVIVASSQAVYGEGQYTCPQDGFILPQPRSQQELAWGDWEVSCPQCGRKANPLPLQEQHSNPYNQYAVSKLAGEKAALGLGWLHGIPTVALRYSITQGARQSLYNHYSGICRIFFSRAMQRRPLIIYEDGRQTRDFIHVQDVVDANMLVLEKDEANFQTFNVGSGNPTTVIDYAGAVLRKVPSAAGVQISGEYRRGDNRHSVSSIQKLSHLGWRARRDLSTIMDDFLAWIESIGGVPEQISDADAHMRNAGVVLSVS
ncbi:MAG TPA: NAD-dependent epimerase/dehydratase family protein [Terriglobales bacterium]|nr:NAD-dependent epimerase/dehydratase family protein [Terriglobales bacterium]